MRIGDAIMPYLMIGMEIQESLSNSYKREQARLKDAWKATGMLPRKLKKSTRKQLVEEWNFNELLHNPVMFS